jgi:hypothetical protein
MDQPELTPTKLVALCIFGVVALTGVWIYEVVFKRRAKRRDDIPLNLKLFQGVFLRDSLGEVKCKD